jgi:cobyrinic acid a,c-diamide synthase
LIVIPLEQKVEKIKHGSKTLAACGGFVALTIHLVKINFSDIEMKLDMIVYNNELHTDQV